MNHGADLRRIRCQRLTNHPPYFAMCLYSFADKLHLRSNDKIPFYFFSTNTETHRFQTKYFSLNLQACRFDLADYSLQNRAALLPLCRNGFQISRTVYPVIVPWLSLVVSLWR